LQNHIVCTLNLLICAGVSDYCLVYSGVVVITEVQELLSSELGAVVGDDRIRDPKAEGNVSSKAYRLFGVNCGHIISLDPFSEPFKSDKHVGKAPRRFFEGSQEI
jgi:hypothetical protein